MAGLKIVMVASEMSPFAKTGGLADVVGALPQAIADRGNEVCVVMPKYADIRVPMELYHSPMGVWMGGVEEWCSVYRTWVGKIPVYFIEQNNYFGRHGIYNDSNMRDYEDNPRRYAFLCRAAMQICIDKDYSPHIFHVHDWQTALLPAYLATWDWRGTVLENTSSILTLHNMAYQGIYPKQNLPYMGIGWEHFTADKFESYDAINMLKGGIHFAPVVNTVSPTYANEITSGQGYGLDNLLRAKGGRFGGILNGVDYNVWSPEADRYIPFNFSKENMDGKWACKTAIQDTFGLERTSAEPLFGIVGRFASQKGYNILAETIEPLMHNSNIQIVILGSGDKELEGFYNHMAHKYPNQFGCHIGFSESLAHLIEAGSDFFVMPSLFEPCGLNQIYSLKYGTLPIVRATGGLNDTVANYNPHTGEGTGFKFHDFTAEALYGTIVWAVNTYHGRPDHMQQLRWNAMNAWFGWDVSAEQYENAYHLALQ